MQYNIEDNFDFYSELLKIKNGMEEPKLKEDGENVCLISNIQLTDKYVTLTCGHKFNYIPLYHDVYNHKTKYNTKENNIDRLKYYEIRCPYCRKKQNKLLPYYPELISEKTHGVNNIDANYLMFVNDYKIRILSKYSKQMKKKNNSSEPSGPEGPSIDNSLLCGSILKYGIHKGEKCNKNIFKDNYCKRHYTLNNKIII
jgi:hypothetical protein